MPPPSLGLPPPAVHTPSLMQAKVLDAFFLIVARLVVLAIDCSPRKAQLSFLVPETAGKHRLGSVVQKKTYMLVAGKVI